MGRSVIKLKLGEDMVNNKPVDVRGMFDKEGIMVFYYKRLCMIDNMDVIIICQTEVG